MREFKTEHTIQTLFDYNYLVPDYKRLSCPTFALLAVILILAPDSQPRIFTSEPETSELFTVLSPT